MFTGIVHSTQNIQSIQKQSGLWRITLDLPADLIDGLTMGASIAINGACLTVCAMQGSLISFDVMMATLNLTNLANLDVGSAVNVERAARFGDDIGGHQLSGHVHGVVDVVAVERPENNCIIWFDLPAHFKKYVFDKGYIGLNGCSLTIAKVEESRFCVYLIPETLSVTVFDDVQVGQGVNLEVDSHTQAIVDTVERVLKQNTLAQS